MGWGIASLQQVQFGIYGDNQELQHQSLMQQFQLLSGCLHSAASLFFFLSPHKVTCGSLGIFKAGLQNVNVGIPPGVDNGKPFYFSLYALCVRILDAIRHCLFQHVDGHCFPKGFGNICARRALLKICDLVIFSQFYRPGIYQPLSWSTFQCCFFPFQYRLHGTCELMTLFSLPGNAKV